MHDFTELADNCAEFILQMLRETNERVIEDLQRSGGKTSQVKALQMLQISKAFFIVGIFSMFEASLQDSLDCNNGFNDAKEILEDKKQHVTKERFNDLYNAINVLKHGRGKSYYTLVAKAKSLPFRIKLPDEYFFSEGEVSEVMTLVEVNDEFVKYCLEVIKKVDICVKCS